MHWKYHSLKLRKCINISSNTTLKDALNLMGFLSLNVSQNFIEEGLIQIY